MTSSGSPTARCRCISGRSSPPQSGSQSSRRKASSGTATRLTPVCGICGIASLDGPVDPGRLARMSATLVHRGPDSAGSFVDGPVALAARRLAIIDLETGDQPIANENSTIHVVQNGELY